MIHFPHRWRRSVRLALTWSIALLFLFPLLWMIAGSLAPGYTPQAAMVRTLGALDLSLDSYTTAVMLVPMGRFALNSMRVVLIAVPLTVLVASLAAFAMTQLPAHTGRLLLWISLAALLAPPTALWLARFPLYRLLGWIDTPLPLLTPALIGGSPLFVLIFYWSFRHLPDELLNAARIDGAGVWRLWWSIVLPAAPAAVAGVALLATVLYWSNFTDPLLYLRSRDQMTMPMGVRLLAQLEPTGWPVLLAGSVLLTLPVLAVVALGLRRIGWESAQMRAPRRQPR